MKIATRTAGALALPAARAARALSRTRSLTVIGWHRIGDADDGLTTSLADFRSQLDMLDHWGARVLPLRTAHRLLEQDQLPERAVVLTFDDGYASVLEQAWPELRDRGLPATLFAVSGYLRPGMRFPWDRAHPHGSGLVRLATAGELASAADEGLDIGSHTVSHRWLPRLSRAEAADEVRWSRLELEDLLARPVTSFAYPMGGWTRQIRDQVEEAGYDVAITVDRGCNRPEQDPFALRRAFAFDRPGDVRRQLDGAFTWMRPIERWRSRKGPRW